MERRGQEPVFQITPETSAEERQRLNWASAKFEAEIRAKALANGNFYRRGDSRTRHPRLKRVYDYWRAVAGFR
jgi:hypothetical protein